MKRDLPVESDGQVAVYAWPDGYPIVYQAIANNPYHRDEVFLCPKCAQNQEDKRNKPVCPDCGSPLEDQDGKPVANLDQVEPTLFGLVCSNKACEWEGGKDDIAEYDVLSAFTHDEGAPIDCEMCSESIESSYGDPEEEKLYDRLRDVLCLTGVFDRDQDEVKTAQEFLGTLSALHRDQRSIMDHAKEPAIYQGYYKHWTLTEALEKHVIGHLGATVPGFWDRASNGASDEWEQDITFASVSLALQAIAAQAQTKGKDQE
jgi:hypothetical protein